MPSAAAYQESADLALGRALAMLNRAGSAPQIERAKAAVVEARAALAELRGRGRKRGAYVRRS